MKIRVPFWVRRIEGENTGAAAASVDNEAAKGADTATDNSSDSSRAAQTPDAESNTEHWKAQARKWERRAKDNQSAT